MKKTLITSITMLLVVGLITGCGCKKKTKETKKEDKITVNTEKEVIKDREIDGIKLENTSLVVTNGISKITTKVTNSTDSDYKLDEYKITFKDAEGKEIVTIPGYVGDTIKSGETKTINSSVDIDLTNAKSAEYEVKK